MQPSIASDFKTISAMNTNYHQTTPNTSAAFYFYKWLTMGDRAVTTATATSGKKNQHHTAPLPAAIPATSVAIPSVLKNLLAAQTGITNAAIDLSAALTEIPPSAARITAAAWCLAAAAEVTPQLAALLYNDNAARVAAAAATAAAPQRTPASSIAAAAGIAQGLDFNFSCVDDKKMAA